MTSEELARLGDTLREGETVGLPYSVDETKPTAKHAAKADHRRVKLDRYAASALRLLILTGARLREILHAKWEQVDVERGLIFLADSKTGKKPLYLSAAAQKVLADLPRIQGNPHVIAGAKDGAPRSDLKKPWAAVSRAAGLEGVRLHDLRHSFASFGAGASLGLPIIGRLLGHSQAATTHRCAHLDADPLRRPLATLLPPLWLATSKIKLFHLGVQNGGNSRLLRGANMAGLVPEIRPEIFESLNTIALAMDAARGDRCGTNQESSMKLQSLLRNYTPFYAPKLVSMIEKLILSVLRCGTIMEKRDVKSLMENNAANARRHKALASQQIDATIKSVILEKYGKFPKSITPNAISNNIQSEVSRILKEKNIRDRELRVSAISKRVKKLSALDG